MSGYASLLLRVVLGAIYLFQAYLATRPETAIGGPEVWNLAI